MQKLNINKTINNFKKPDENLYQRAVSGGFWVFSLRIVQQLFSLIRLVVLARILAPSDFGLMGIALLTMMTLETFSQPGFHAALIQKKKDIEPYLDITWTVLILRGFILFAILYLLAPYAAIFFNVPEAKPIIQVIGFTILLQAFTNIGVIYFQKELEFNKLFIYQLSGTLADFVVAVSAAFILKSVWALVFGLLAAAIVRFVVSYFIHPYRPRLSFDLGKAKELFGFGKWVMGSSILIFLLTSGDDIFVGKLLGVTLLGYYQMAYRISNMPATEISHVISQVTFPVYSKLQDDVPKLREAYLKVLQVTAFLSFPIAGLIFVLAPDFTMIFLGEKWMPMVPAMQALTIFGVTRSINATLGSVFLGLNRPYVNTRGSAIQLAIFVAIIYPLTSEWGILGASVAVIIPNVFWMLYIGRKLSNALNYNLLGFIEHLLPQITGSAIMSFIILVFRGSNNGHFISFFTLILIGICIYIAIVSIIDKIFDCGMGNNLKHVFREIW